MGGKHYAVMEKCEMSLTHMMDNIRDLAPPYHSSTDISRSFREMALGLAYVHSMRLLHRDVQPANFFFGSVDGRTAQLGGFGLAVSLPKEGSLRAPCASPTAFSSPEMLSGKPYSEATDAWSFGVTLYLVLFGSYPYVVLSRKSTMKSAIIANDPAPSFRRTDSIEDFEPDTRDKIEAYLPEATVLVAALLRHTAARRCSAEDALHDVFLRTEHIAHAHDSRRAEEYRMLRSQTIARSSSSVLRDNHSKARLVASDEFTSSLSTSEGSSIAASNSTAGTADGSYRRLRS